VTKGERRSDGLQLTSASRQRESKGERGGSAQEAEGRFVVRLREGTLLGKENQLSVRKRSSLKRLGDTGDRYQVEM